MKITKYKQLQIIKHALQHYVDRPKAGTEKHIVSELNLLEKVTKEVEEMKVKYDIK
jgi:hypothetical protein